MKIRKLWPLYVLLIAVGLPGARLAWRLTTSELGWMDNNHRVHFARMTQPARAWEEIAERTVEVRADKETMSRLQSEVLERGRSLQ